MRSARALAITLVLTCLHTVFSTDRDQTQIERYQREARRTYQLDVPGKDPITIVEEEEPTRWMDISVKDATTPKDGFRDVTIDHSRCFGPSCREDGYGDGPEISPPDHLEEFLLEYADRVQGTGEDAKERLHAISSLASKLNRDKIKPNRFSEEVEDTYPYSTWNKIKVKRHKHPYDDRDGWVTMEAVPYSTSKVSKWKPNTSRPRPNHWDDDSSFDEDRFQSSTAHEDYRKPTKKPSVIMNRPHLNTDWGEMPSKPTWTQQASYPAAWSPDDGRRPHKPDCDSDSHRHPASEVYYGVSDSVMTDGRPSDFPYEYQALQRPHRPTQVVYADFEDKRRPSSHPSNGEGQWVLLSTTKGYHRSKKRPRAMNLDDSGSVTSHKTVALTVLPRDDGINTTTSHGGLLEVERSFKTVEESKRDSDRQEAQESFTESDPSDPDPIAEASQVITKQKKKIVRRLLTPGSADGSTIMAAVGAGMLPATMAMVVPMMLGKKRKRRDVRMAQQLPHLLFRYE